MSTLIGFFVGIVAGVFLCYNFGTIKGIFGKIFGKGY